MHRKKRPARRGRTASALEKGALLSLALGDLACSQAPPTAAADASPPVVIAPAPSESAPRVDEADSDAREPLERLSPYVVLPGKIARRTLYTWTTRAQVEALAKDRVLLTRSESPEHGASYFDQVLARRAGEKDPLVMLLRTSAFARARFAWPAPWATLLGTGDESYGDELVQITLKPEAWIVVLRASVSKLEVIDLEDRPVPVAGALANPERIAAVHFIQDKPATGIATSTAGPEERMAYREFVVCNESMIASWSLHTEEIRGELEASAAAMTALGRFLRAHPAKILVPGMWHVSVASQTWKLSEPTRTPLGLYEASLAFPNQKYFPNADALLALADKLRAIPMDGPAIVQTPRAVFPRPAAPTPSPPPRVEARQRRGTF
jgi:hypothetical protein